MAKFEVWSFDACGVDGGDELSIDVDASNGLEAAIKYAKHDMSFGYASTALTVCVRDESGDVFKVTVNAAVRFTIGRIEEVVEVAA